MNNKDSYYEKALVEIESKNYIKSTYSRALRYSDGNDSKIKSLYIKYRVKSLQKEADDEEEKKRIPSFAEKNFVKILSIFLGLLFIIVLFASINN
jgi:hypothetical protein